MARIKIEDLTEETTPAVETDETGAADGAKPTKRRLRIKTDQAGGTPAMLLGVRGIAR